jgi:hypothetical protein
MPSVIEQLLSLWLSFDQREMHLLSVPVDLEWLKFHRLLIVYSQCSTLFHYKLVQTVLSSFFLEPQNLLLHHLIFFLEFRYWRMSVISTTVARIPSSSSWIRCRPTKEPSEQRDHTVNTTGIMGARESEVFRYTSRSEEEKYSDVRIRVLS